MNTYRIKCWCVVDRSGNAVPEARKCKGVNAPAVFLQRDWAEKELEEHSCCEVVECEAVIDAVADQPNVVVPR